MQRSSRASKKATLMSQHTLIVVMCERKLVSMYECICLLFSSLVRRFFYFTFVVAVAVALLFHFWLLFLLPFLLIRYKFIYGLLLCECFRIRETSCIYQDRAESCWDMFMNSKKISYGLNLTEWRSEVKHCRSDKSSAQTKVQFSYKYIKFSHTDLPFRCYRTSFIFSERKYSRAIKSE